MEVTVMRKRSKILIILGVVAAALITAIVVLACTAQIYDPNKQLKKHAVEITAGEETGAKFNSNLEIVGMTAGTASFRFTPEEMRALVRPLVEEGFVIQVRG